MPAPVRMTRYPLRDNVRILPMLAGLLLTFGSASCQAQTYDLYRANLHAHTAMSDGGIAIVTYPQVATPGTAAQWAKAVYAQAGVPGVFATSDHGEYLTAANWEATKQQLRDQTAPGAFVGLPGFEWTGTADGLGPQIAEGLGHLNVYGSAVRAGKGALRVNGQDVMNLEPENHANWVWRHRVSGGSVVTTGSLYQWILNNKTSPLGGTIVAQFNHPGLYPKSSLANPSENFVDDGSGNNSGEWWRKLEYVPQLDPYITLMEMGGWTTLNPPYYNGAINEQYFSLALDNGWHVSPTNSEDNHSDQYCQLRVPSRAGFTDLAGIGVYTGIWAERNAGDTKEAAQGKILAALRERRTFAVEDKAASPNNKTFAVQNALTLKWTLNTPSGLKWMGSRNLLSTDVSGNRCRLEITRPAGLQLATVQVITNRGLVAKTLPLSGPGVLIDTTTKTATWEFGLVNESPGPSLRTFYCPVEEPYTVYNQAPFPAPQGLAPLVIRFDARRSGQTDRYFYVRVQQTDGTWAFSAPIWMNTPRKTPASYRWTFGDGSGNLEDTAGEVAHTYTATGTYYPRVLIRYTDGSTDIAVSRVFVGTGTPSTFKGDVDGDGQITRDDVTMVSKAVSGLGTLTAEQKNRADLRAPSGVCDIVDLQALTRFLNGTGIL